MRKKRVEKKDIVSFLSDVQKNIILSKPSFQKMREEVCMMKFQIRPLQGDISTIPMNNPQLIEFLWNLGKLDEVFQKEMPRLSVREEEMVFRFFDSLYNQFHKKIHQHIPGGANKNNAILEMEIFREHSTRRKTN